MPDRSDYSLPATVGEPPSRLGRTLPEVEFERGLPASLDSERTVLGCILLDNAVFNEASETLQPTDFALDAHQRIFRRIGELIDAGIAVDLITLAEELQRHKEVESVGGVAFLASLTEGLPRRLSITEWVRLIREKAQLRRIINLASTAITRCADQSETPLPILEDLEAEVLEIAQEANVGKLRSIRDSVAVTGGVQPYLDTMTHPAQKQGIPTGYIDLDGMTGGLQPGDLTIIAARPSAGKSALAINIAENVGVGTENVIALFSLEMSRSSVERRFMASRARVDIRRAMNGEFLSQLEKDKMFRALGDLVESHIFIDDTAVVTPTQIRAKCRRLKQREGRLDLVICDYIQLVHCGQKVSTREQEVAIVSRSMKAMAKELDIPVVAIAQINRQAEQRADKRPVLSDLRESGALEQDGDLVLLVHRDELYQRDNDDVKGLADIICAKSRNGPTGAIKLAYIDYFTRFENLARGV